MKSYVIQALVATFALLISTTAVTTYAQLPQGMEEVSGAYTNSDAGVSMTFPDGWSGTGFAAQGSTMAMTVPGGMSAGGDIQKAIIIVIADKAKVTGDPTDPSSYSDQAPKCTTPTPTETTVSGKKGFEMVMECTNDDGTTSKMKMTIAETTDDRIIVMYMSPVADFDADVAKYDASVDSLQIAGAIDASIGSMPPGGGTTGGEMVSSTMPVMVAGESIGVAVQSASTISTFELNEASKSLSFMADGSGDKTVVSVGKVLNGPYSVTVDGVTTQAVEATDSSGVKTLTVPHTSGAHQISITGTQVVPEFPVAMIGVVGALIAIISVVGRTRLVKGKI